MKNCQNSSRLQEMPGERKDLTEVWTRWPYTLSPSTTQKSADSQISLDSGPQMIRKFHHEKPRPEFYQSPALSFPFSHSLYLPPTFEVPKTHDNLHDFQPSVYLRTLPTYHANDTFTNRNVPNSHTSHLPNPGRHSHLTQSTRLTTQPLLPHPPS